MIGQSTQPGVNGGVELWPFEFLERLADLVPLPWEHQHKCKAFHDTSRITWAKLMARVGEKFPLHRLDCGGDIRPIAFITELGPIRKILAHLGELLEPPPVFPASGPPAQTWARSCRCMRT